MAKKKSNTRPRVSVAPVTRQLRHDTQYPKEVHTRSAMQADFYRCNGIRPYTNARPDEIGNMPDLYGKWVKRSDGSLMCVPARLVSQVPIDSELMSNHTLEHNLIREE